MTLKVGWKFKSFQPGSTGKNSHKVTKTPRKNIYFVAENLVFWARSEPLGYAVNLLQAGAE
ncbi:hypothetical protein D1AOALGA4SA_3264 [Olavius algarvensis Delta 1 endosymbiont]|nr:hypothetical protein D1AOALGA4SA_3264 [Olavius algarvensis Delta 1 endosymbiont]